MPVPYNYYEPMNTIKLIVTTAFGLEAVLRQELENLGFKDLKTTDGRIEFPADFSDIPKANFWLRSADRVLLKLAEFTATDFDQLFDPVCDLPWERWIPKDGKITVVGKSAKSKLMSVRTCQSMIKKAVIKRLQPKYKVDRFSESGPEFIISFSIFKDVVQLTLDTTGPGLNRRGYRTHAGEVPMKETLAAALILLSNWNQEKILIDPMCGSGTILIEAALMARNIAPGLNREFISEHWAFLDKKLWKEARAWAKKAIRASGEVKIFGYDVDTERIKDGQGNAKRAGVQNDIIFKRQDIADFQVEQERGVVITNPPYGLKLEPGSDLVPLYTALDRVLGTKNSWALYIITADSNFPQYFKRSRPDKIRKLYNGPVEVSYFQYYGR
jgi:putative N6-adenine-specific DNA methylase